MYWTCHVCPDLHVLCGFHAFSHNISRTELFLIYFAWWMQGTSNFYFWEIRHAHNSSVTLSVGGPVLKDESTKTQLTRVVVNQKNNKVGPKFPIRRKSHGVVGHDFLWSYYSCNPTCACLSQVGNFCLYPLFIIWVIFQKGGLCWKLTTPMIKIENQNSLLAWLIRLRLKL